MMLLQKKVLWKHIYIPFTLHVDDYHIFLDKKTSVRDSVTLVFILKNINSINKT